MLCRNCSDCVGGGVDGCRFRYSCGTMNVAQFLLMGALALGLASVAKSVDEQSRIYDEDHWGD